MSKESNLTVAVEACRAAVDAAKKREGLGMAPLATMPYGDLQAVLDALERTQLTDDQIRARKPIGADFVSFRAGIRSIELDMGIHK